MSSKESGITDVRSAYPVAETISKLETLAVAQGLMVFARIDFSGDALRAGLTLRPMQMLLFGNPKAGTPLLAAAPRSGLDLPLKALAWEDPDGAVWVSFNSPAYIADRHSLPSALIANISGLHTLIERATSRQ